MRVRAALPFTVVLAGLLSWSPATAGSTAIVGSGTWSGTAYLPLYPCPGGCSTTFTGSFQGSMTVLDASGVPTYEATWPSGSTSNLSAGPFTYTESCGTVAALPPDAGSASGPFSISGGVLTLDGRVVGTATLTGTFGWQRTENAVTVGATGVTLWNGNTAIASASDAGAGAGVMGPPVWPVGALPPSCANIEPVTVAVAGNYVQPG